MSEATLITASNTVFDTYDNRPLERRKSSCWCGKVCYEIRDSIVDIAKGVAAGARKVVRVFGQLRMDATTFGRVVRLGVYSFSVIESTFGRSGMFSKIDKRLKNTDGMIDTFQIFDAMSYFCQGKFKNDSVCSIIANTAFFAAGVGGVVMVLGEASLIAMSKLGTALGSIPVFGIVFKTGVGLGELLNGFVIVGFGALSGCAIQKLCDKKATRDEKHKAILDLVWDVSEIALKVFSITTTVVALAGVTLNPIGVGVGMLTLGSIAAGLGITSYLYGISLKEKKEKERQQLCLTGKCSI